ncbi:MAG: hypothetical protein GQ579_00220, partial [Bacteroidales bacterium]|nr:hypothetical protein [Bacteroidales bacterium]
MKSTFRFAIFVLIIYSSTVANGQETLISKKQDAGRQIIPINSDWKFFPGKYNLAGGIEDDEGCIDVDLPHTWNDIDPFDDKDGYHRGTCWYQKTIELNEKWREKKIYLYFEGVNQVASVYLNGECIGEHKGGYTAFALDISDHVDWSSSDNLIAVKVDNSHNPQIPPLSVGYALYGGIYRDVYLLVTDPVHIDLDDHASKGFYITVHDLSHENAAIQVNGIICNDLEPGSILVKAIIKDAEGKEVMTQKSLLNSNTGRTRFELIFDNLKDPHLWSPEDPYLYSLELSLHHNGSICDKIITDFGLRYFSFHPRNGFSLNGMPYKIKGTNRHQDIKNFGSALTNQMHYEDLKNIKEMGCNFVRLAHYPQDPAVLEAADKLGLLVWEEIPLVNYITEDEDFSDNCVLMIKEMVRQHFNHPSVIIWGSMNEILLWSKQGKRIRKHEDIQYLQSVKKLAEKLDETIRMEDPTRYSGMAIHSSSDYFNNGIAQIPMILGFNLYHGWYSGSFGGFTNQLLRIHINNPESVIFISEYGAGSDQRLESSDPVRFDFTGR